MVIKQIAQAPIDRCFRFRQPAGLVVVVLLVPEREAGLDVMPVVGPGYVLANRVVVLLAPGGRARRSKVVRGIVWAVEDEAQEGYGVRLAAGEGAIGAQIPRARLANEVRRKDVGEIGVQITGPAGSGGVE